MKIKCQSRISEKPWFIEIVKIKNPNLYRKQKLQYCEERETQTPMEKSEKRDNQIDVHIYAERKRIGKSFDHQSLI